MSRSDRIHGATLAPLITAVAMAATACAQPGPGPGPGYGPHHGYGMGPGMMPMRPGMPGMGPGMRWNMPGFTDFDRDGDGRISQTELQNARAERQRSRAELGYPMRGAANAPAFSAIDTDDSGSITPGEFERYHSAGRRPWPGGR